MYERTGLLVIVLMGLLWSYSQKSISQTPVWEQAAGIFSDNIEAIVIDSSHSLLVSAGSHGVYRSSDSGGKWTKISSQHILAIAVSQNGMIFAGSLGAGIFRSTNNGEAWTQANIGLSNPNIMALVANSLGYVFAGTVGGGVYRSTNNGETWAQVNNGLRDSVIVEMCIAPSGHILAGTAYIGYFGIDGTGVSRSTDNGETWTQTTLNSVMIRSFAIGGNNSIFAAANSFMQLLRTTDEGLSWTVVPISPVSCVYADSRGFLFAGLEYGGISHSADNGASWVAGRLEYPERVKCIAGLGGRIYAGLKYGGLFKSSDDGWTWNQTGVTPVRILSLATKDSNGVFAGTESGIYRSINRGLSWDRVSSLPGYDICIGQSGQILAAVSGGGVVTSTDNGNSWNVLFGQYGYLFYSVGIDPTEQIILTGASERYFFKSSDGGNNWSAVNMTINPVPVREFAFKSNGLFFMSGGWMWRSNDYGANWIGIGSGLENGSYSTVAINSQGTLFSAGYWTRVHRSSNDGDGWSQLPTEILRYQSLLINGNDHIFAATEERGVLRSTDQGNSWSPFNAGLLDTMVFSLSIDSAGYVYAGTDAGVYRTVATTTLPPDTTMSLPQQFLLEQNYPNPFNLFTVIKYQLQASSAVTLRIIDVLGREVKVLVNEVKGKGEHTVNWNAEGVSSGVYFYKLIAGSFVSTKKMVLVK